MGDRKDIPRCPRPDGRVSQTGCIDKAFNHEVFSQSECDNDPMVKFTVPDCAYRSYDSFTWPEGKACEEDLPGHGCNHQSDETEDIKPTR
jgi:hypothetical protein